jgi:hypothetical protein
MQKPWNVPFFTHTESNTLEHLTTVLFEMIETLGLDIKNFLFHDIDDIAIWLEKKLASIFLCYLPV